MTPGHADAIYKPLLVIRYKVTFTSTMPAVNRCRTGCSQRPVQHTCVVADGGRDGAQGACKSRHGKAALAGGARPHVIHHPGHLQSHRGLPAVSRASHHTRGGSQRSDRSVTAGRLPPDRMFCTGTGLVGSAPAHAWHPIQRLQLRLVRRFLLLHAYVCARPPAQTHRTCTRPCFSCDPCRPGAASGGSLKQVQVAEMSLILQRGLHLPISQH